MVTLIALFGTALLFGTSAFGFLMTPLIARGLADTHAAAYLRQLFPAYYMILMIGGVVAATAFALEAHPIRAGIMLLVAVLAAAMRQVIGPHLTKLQLAADDGAKPGGQYVLLIRVALLITFIHMAGTGTVLAWFVV